MDEELRSGFTVRVRKIWAHDLGFISSGDSLCRLNRLDA